MHSGYMGIGPSSAPSLIAEADRRQRRSAGIGRRKRARKRSARKKPERLLRLLDLDVLHCAKLQNGLNMIEILFFDRDHVFRDGEN